MMEQRRSYLTDDELDRLIADVECQGLLQSPSYLRNEVLAGTENSLQKRKLQFYIYSVKVCAAAAAAIFVLFTIPAGQLTMPKQVADRQQETLLDKLGRQADVMCESVNNFSDMLIMKEKQED